MFLSEWREFPSAPCLARGGAALDDSSRLDVFFKSHRHASELVSFLVGLRTYQYPDLYLPILRDVRVHQTGDVRIT